MRHFSSAGLALLFVYPVPRVSCLLTTPFIVFDQSSCEVSESALPIHVHQSVLSVISLHCETLALPRGSSADWFYTACITGAPYPAFPASQTLIYFVPRSSFPFPSSSPWCSPLSPTSYDRPTLLAGIRPALPLGVLTWSPPWLIPSIEKGIYATVCDHSHPLASGTIPLTRTLSRTLKSGDRRCLNVPNSTPGPRIALLRFCGKNASRSSLPPASSFILIWLPIWDFLERAGLGTGFFVFSAAGAWLSLPLFLESVCNVSFSSEPQCSRGLLAGSWGS